MSDEELFPEIYCMVFRYGLFYKFFIGFRIDVWFLANAEPPTFRETWLVLKEEWIIIGFVVDFSLEFKWRKCDESCRRVIAD